MLKDIVPELRADERIVIAYDDMNLDEASTMHASFNRAGFFPVAKANSLAVLPGLDAVTQNFASVMYDPKFHDTENTMHNYITEVANAYHSPLMVTLHAANGMTALTEAVRARDDTVGEESGVLNLLGITVLTSLDDDDVVSIYGEGETAESKFVDFAHRAEEAGLQGLVSSGKELVKGYEYEQLNGLLRVIPGIKLPDTADTKGQKRLYTPDVAISEGADFVVIGRAITEAEDPVAALELAVELVDRAA